MKLWLLVLLSPVALAQKAIQFQWSAGPSPGWTTCTSGSYCLTGYSLYETTSGSPVLMAVVPQTATSYVAPLPSVGYHLYQVTQNGLVAGNTVHSAGNHTVSVNCTRVSGWRKCVPGKSW